MDKVHISEEIYILYIYNNNATNALIIFVTCSMRVMVGLKLDTSDTLSRCLRGRVCACTRMIGIEENAGARCQHNWTRRDERWCERKGYRH